jgi:hypothetical protein
MSRVQYSLSALTDSTLTQSFQRVSFSTLSVGSNHGLPRRVRLQRVVSVSRNLRWQTILDNLVRARDLAADQDASEEGAVPPAAVDEARDC